MAKSEPSSAADQAADPPADETTGGATSSVASTKTGKTGSSAKTGKKTGKSGNPAKASQSGKAVKSGRSGSAKLSKAEEKQVFRDPTAAGPAFSLRAALALLLVVAGIAWITFYYVAVRADPLTGAEPTGPGFLGDLGDWNYLIGFGAFFLGLILAAHPSTPLGRGRGVVTGMLFCFLFGLAWICVFYAITSNPDSVPVFNDLGQKNLFVGIASMGVGFVYATRWE